MGGKIALRKVQDQVLADKIAAALFACLERQDNQIKYLKDAEFEGLVPILVDLLVYPKAWEQSEILRFVRRGIINSKKGQLETFKDIIEKANTEAADLFVAQEHAYKMWTKVSLRYDKGPSLVFNIQGVHVRISKNPPRKVDLKPYFINGLGDIDPHLPKGGMYITASGMFRSDEQAGYGLYKAISHVVTLLNFGQHSHIRQIKFGKNRPKSNALLGENQFLFRGSNDLNKSLVWYNPHFIKDNWEASSQTFSNIAQFASDLRSFRKSLFKLSFSDRILSAIDVMIDGWSSTDTNYRILRSWTAYEILLSRSVSRTDSYEDIARRAVFIAKNSEFLLLRLKHAARSRNKYVHENANILAADEVLGGVESYFLQLVRWIVFQRIPFESHEEMINIFNMSTDVKTLKKQIRQLNRALKIKGG